MDDVMEMRGVSTATGSINAIEGDTHVLIALSDGHGVKDCFFTPAEVRRIADQLRWLADRIDNRDKPEVTIVMGMAESMARAAGGHARARNLSPERRSEIARAAAKKRWSQQ